jgi:uncharacterized protein (TIGR02118 family)
MIKLVYVITRRADLSHEAFADYWLNHHGPLVAAQAKALRLKKYVQSHLVDTPANEGMRAVRGMLPPVDGITEVWWDSPAELAAAYATPEGAAAGKILAEDEAKFIDFTKSSVFLTTEHEIFDHTGGKGPGPDAMKVTYLLNRRPDLTQAACHETWLNDHGPLVTSVSKLLNMARYVQSHSLPGQGPGDPARGFEPPLDGITEVWIGSGPGGGDAEESRKASASLVEDERRFVDMPSSRCFLTREHLIFDHT